MFYAENAGVPLRVTNEVCTNNGEILLHCEGLLVGSYLLTFVAQLTFVKGKFYPQNSVDVKSSLYEHMQSQREVLTSSATLYIM